MSEQDCYVLKEITTKIGSGATPTGGSSAYKSEGVSLIRSQNVLDLRFSPDGLAFIDENQANELKNVALKANDVLLNITGDSVARVCKVPTSVLPARVNQHVCIIRADEIKLNSDYLLYYLIDNKDLLLSLSEIGGTRNALTKGMIEDLTLSLPKYSEQIAIAEVLNSLDDKIDLLHRQNKTLEEMAQTLFRQWFVEEADESWDMGTISEIIEFNPKRSLCKDSIAPYLEMSEVSTSTYAPDGWYNRKFTSGTKFTNGDTLLARITPCLENGKTAYVNFLEPGQVGWGSTEFIVMRPKPDYHPLLAYVIARTKEFREFAESCMTGTTGRQRVDVDNLASYEIQIPKSPYIRRFNKYCDESLRKLSLNTNQIQTLTQLRDNLLPKFMNGELSIIK